MQSRASGRPTVFTRWAGFVSRHPRSVLAASLGVLALSIAAMPLGGTLQNTYPEGTESSRAWDLMESELPSEGIGFELVLTHPALRWEERAFRSAVDAALAPLVDDPRVESVRTPWSGDAHDATRLVSEDGHRVLVRVTLAADAFPVAVRDYADLRPLVTSPVLDVKATGEVALQHDFDVILEEDLRRAEFISLPLVLLLLLIVFGTVVAALLPLGVGALAVTGGAAGVLLLAHVMDVAQYAMNIVTLIGLGVAIDYSLFVVTRHREELAEGAPVPEALARALDTAGRAIAYSGVTVAIGLGSLLFFKGSFLASMGLAGTLVVALAVLYALTFLPAVLVLLGPRVEKGRIPGVDPRASGRAWARLARGVMKHPVVVIVPVLIVLLAAGIPFKDAQLAAGDVEMLPQHAESRQGYDLVQTEFPGQDESPFVVVVHWPGGEPLSREHVAEAHRLSRAFAAEDGVERVESIVDLDPRLTLRDYQDLYASPRSEWPDGVADVVDATVGEHALVLRVLTDLDPRSDAAHALLQDLRAVAEPEDGEVLVTGRTAFDVDLVDYIFARAPAAVAFVLIVTYLLVLAQVRSVVIPAKAVAMNLLSITASFGAMVWIFQEGHFADILNFTPTPLDPTLPVILFAVVFGLSMDYEVLLLSRVHEEYTRSRDNAGAVAHGLAKTGRLITGAAAIMVVVFSAFATSDVIFVKAIGFGLALAIAVDATLVRALVVPALMRLMGNANWWAPRWLPGAANAQEECGALAPHEEAEAFARRNE